MAGRAQTITDNVRRRTEVDAQKDSSIVPTQRRRSRVVRTPRPISPDPVGDTASNHKMPSRNSAERADRERVIEERLTKSGRWKGYTRTTNVVLADTALSVGARLLYVQLLSFDWQNRAMVFPGMDTLGHLCGVSVETVRTWRRELEEAGLVTTKRRGLGKTNDYGLVLHDEVLRLQRYASRVKGCLVSDTKSPDTHNAKASSELDRHPASAKVDKGQEDKRKKTSSEETHRAGARKGEAQSPKQLPEGTPGKPYDLAEYFDREARRLCPDGMILLEPTNKRALAKKFRGWMDAGCSPEVIRRMVDLFVGDTRVFQGDTRLWISFVSKRDGLLERAEVDVAAASNEDRPQIVPERYRHLLENA